MGINKNRAPAMHGRNHRTTDFRRFWLGRRSWVVAATLSASALTAGDRAPPEAENPDRLDQFRQTFAQGLDTSVRWVDGLFGSERFASGNQGANGQFYVRTIWQEYRGVSVRTRLRANLPLDHVNHRFNAFIGKGNTDDIVQDKNQNPYLGPERKDSEWLAGLGYAPAWSKDKSISFNAGVVLTWPPDPYVRASYRYQHALSEAVGLQFTPGIFWKESEQFGASTSLDLNWKISDDFVLRFPNWVKVSGATEGAEYDSRVQLYQKLPDSRAILYGFGVQGATGSRVAVRQYGAYVVYRQKMFREWFTGEVILGGTLLREDLWISRKFSLAIGLGCEFSFDARRDQAASSLANRFFRSRL
jgi:hypothetical protein